MGEGARGLWSVNAFLVSSGFSRDSEPRGYGHIHKCMCMHLSLSLFIYLSTGLLTYLPMYLHEEIYYKEQALLIMEVSSPMICCLLAGDPGKQILIELKGLRARES